MSPRVARAWVGLAWIAMAACDRPADPPETLYLADATQGEATVLLVRPTEGYSLRAEHFALSYFARGAQPSCGCVEVDAGAWSGAPQSMLEEVAALGAKELTPGAGSIARICAKDFGAADEDGYARGQGELELGTRRIPVELRVSLTPAASSEAGHEVRVEMQLPLTELGLPVALLEAEMVDLQAPVEYRGKSRKARDVDAKTVRKICGRWI